VQRFLACAVGAHADQIAAFHCGVEFPVGADCDVLGAEFGAGVDRLQTREARVRGVLAGVAGRRLRLPRDRLDGHGPEAEIGNRRD